ncbi:5-formyltetrahydrofolate cyclo-ligase [candidate division NPL-UPA2 bacterium]|nr:5-formyltetrahydrofolate cyclo-ligase [candidate division NPL-UPA2 bacterium]
MEEKKSIRKEILVKRNGLSEEAVREKSQRIKKKLFELLEFKKAKTVMFYVAKDKEARTEEIIRESLKMGKRVAVPISKVKERDLIPSLLTAYGELVPGAYGILEPGEECRQPVPLESLELIIVPGVAFDRQGNRLGFGGGFYDNFLGKVPANIPRLGLAFELQLVEELPGGENDIPVDGIVTEERIYLRDKAQRHKVTKAQRI